ncbi:c-type cytochrome [Thermochromatium tepidum]|uniref:Cytochrome c4 n=3 Tax=Thermochromatium tepidum TaxID=1050 RepID=A0A6I6DVI8_THETI|nr:c-type cytochrome [Thermochromatium tepidum]QGU31554.1 cytochrome c4 [Thermochromatium tepidum ATCC 43061]BAI48109.1 flavocytochrome c heme subunit precursor [Thermochromatium tepidum]
MTPSTKRLMLAVSVLASGLASNAGAEPTAEMLANNCAGCHGTRGNSAGPASPSIAQMDPAVFVEVMEQFKSGEIQSTIMGRIAKGYSTADFQKMAEYFKQQTYQPVKQSFDKALVAKGTKLHDKYCEKCHVESGKPLADQDEYHILAGQWTPYLRYAIEDFRAERRPMEKKMASKLKELLKAEGEDGLDALFAFYASQQ